MAANQFHAFKRFKPVKSVFVLVFLFGVVSYPFFSSVLQTPFLLSDSRLHLFLQSELSITKIARCVLGKTRYTVAEAIQRCNRDYMSRLEDKGSCDSDCERYEL